MPKFTTSDGTRLHYRVGGSGSPVLIFVHGWCSNLKHWEPQATYFASRHRVLRYDRRGHGQSDVPTTGYTPSQHAEDLAELMRSQRIRKAVVLGHAGGAPTILEFACRYPQMVEAVVAVDAGLYTPRSIAPQVQSMVRSLDGPNYQRRFRKAYRGFFDPRSDRRITEKAVAEAECTPKAVALAEMKSFAISTQALSRGVEQPVLWLVASTNPNSNPVVAKKVLKRGQYGQVVGVGHFPQLEDPAQVNAMIERFLRNL